MRVCTAADRADSGGGQGLASCILGCCDCDGGCVSLVCCSCGPMEGCSRWYAASRQHRIASDRGDNLNGMESGCGGTCGDTASPNFAPALHHATRDQEGSFRR